MLELELENCQSGAKGLKTKFFPDEQLINLAFLLVSSCGMKVKKLEIVEACVSAKADYQFCEVQLTKDLSVLVQVVTDDLFTFVIDKLNKDGVFVRRVGISSLSFFDLDKHGRQRRGRRFENDHHSEARMENVRCVLLQRIYRRFAGGEERALHADKAV